LTVVRHWTLQVAEAKGLPVPADARRLLLAQFRWVSGHADVWRVFRDADALRSVVAALVDPYRDLGLAAVVGVESRGFLLGGAAAVELGVGFVAVRKAGGLFAGHLIGETTAPDYRGRRWELAMQDDALAAGDRALLVDDWIETGSQAHAAGRLVARLGATLAGISVLVDHAPHEARPGLPPVRSIVSAADLPADDTTDRRFAGEPVIEGRSEGRA
jgi:adenine phosphoribosyltransferase